MSKGKAIRLLGGLLSQCKLISGQGCKPRSKQLKEVVQLLFRAQFTPREYYLYRFFEDKMEYSDMLNYLPNYYLTRYLRPVLNNPEWEYLFENKMLFNIYFREHKLPVQNIYGYFDRFSGFTATGKPLTNEEELKALLLFLKPPALVIKPLLGGQGVNILVFERMEYSGREVTGILSEGRRYSMRDIYSHMLKKTPGFPFKGYLLEERVAQHEMLAEINHSSLNTVRAVTLLGQDNKTHLVFSVLRMGRAGSGIDNSSLGGLYASIDPDSGAIGEAVFNMKYDRGRYTRHPDSGIMFAGKQIPFWKEVVRLCHTAARLSPFCRTVGWDVGITPGGPVLIEGNQNHSMEIQTQYGGYLQPEVRKILASYQLNFHEKELPPISIGPLWEVFK